MCIIVAIPAGVKMPAEETIRNCFNSNSDGAGFMYADGKVVRIRKGFMTYAEFVKALDDEEIPEDTGVVLHFRIATHGKVQPSCCHPFPISANPADLKALRIDARWGVAHNGVISGRSTSADWSDTMDFITDVMAPLAKMNPNFMHNEHAIDLLDGACQSKLAILDNAGDIALVGTFIEDEGVFYSNTYYLPTKYNWSSYGSFWDSAYYEYDELSWDAIEKRVANLKYEACQICPNRLDCAEFTEWCHSEIDAIESVADAESMSMGEVADMLGMTIEEA